MSLFFRYDIYECNTCQCGMFARNLPFRINHQCFQSGKSDFFIEMPRFPQTNAYFSLEKCPEFLGQIFSDKNAEIFSDECPNFVKQLPRFLQTNAQIFIMEFEGRRFPKFQGQISESSSEKLS